MNKFSKFIVLISSFILLNSCGGQGCDKLDKTFDTYESTLDIIKSANFQFTDDCNTSKSSWICDAEYFSCNGKTGFLVIETNSQTYIHNEVPIKIWSEFKKAESFGKFYNRNLKGRFRITL
ncbi:KTSC domain-containing protein [Arenibacter sp. M-2]|uniref:KTSC domain-containing protein n=1 Tax=Arenibacter sp. M-2 TaxID=3053612 RepID=UPI003364F77E